MSKTVNTKILLRNDTYSNWQTNNPTLAKGEIGAAIITQNGVTTKNFKIGDGVTPWNDLSWDGRLQEEILEGILRTQKRSGSIVTFDDGADAPLKECICQIQGSQELNGYDYPWPPDGGKNKLPLIVEDMKSRNTTGSWNGNVYTNGGIVYTIQTDKQGQVTGILANGTSTGSTFYLSKLLSASDYNGMIASGCPSGGSASTYAFRIGMGNGGWYTDTKDIGDGVTINTGNYSTIIPAISVYTGATVSNILFKPMIRLSSVSDATYAPYSNICPITGWDGMNVVRTGKNLLNPDIDSYTMGRSYRYNLNVVPNGASARMTFIDKDTGVDISGCYIGFIQSDYNNNQASPQFFRWCIQNGVVNTNTTNSASLSASYLCGGVFIYPNTLDTFNKIFSRFNIMVELGTTATEFEEYQPADSHSISFPSTVYSGYVDVVSKKLVVTYGSIDLGSCTWSKYIEAQNPTYHTRITGMATNRAKAICSNYGLLKSWVDVRSIPDKMAETHPSLNAIYIRDDAYETAADFKAAMSGVQLVYELVEPVEYDIDIPIIKSRQGFNTIWTNADNLELEYYKQNFQESVNDVNHFDIYINPQDDENLVVAADMTNPNTSIWINPNGPNYVMPNVNVSKSDNVTTVTTTNNIGATNSVEIVDGVDGITPNLTIGEVEALPFDDDATVEITGTQENPVLNFGIPKILQDEETEMAAIATFDDGAYDMPLKSCICQVDAVQDLHGQDAPYPAGGGKNLLQVTGTSVTRNGVTFTVSNDGTISCSGNASATTEFTVNSDWRLGESGETYIISGCPSGGSGNKYKLDIRYKWTADGGSGASFTIDSEVPDNNFVRIVLYEGYGNGLVFKPMIRLASVSDATFAPYSNICPITGWDGVNVVRTGKNLIEGFLPNAIGSITGGVSVLSTAGSTVYFSCKSGEKYTLSCGETINRCVLAYFGGKPTVGSETTIYVSNNSLTMPYTFTAQKTGYVAIYLYNALSMDVINASQIEVGTSATTYETPSPDSHSLSFPQTVYGGWVDVVKGELHVTHKMIALGDYSYYKSGNKFYISTIEDFDISAGTSGYLKFGTGLSDVFNFMRTNWDSYNNTITCYYNNSYNGYRIFFRCDDYSSNTVAEFKAYMTSLDAHFCYKLAQETIIDLDPVTIKTLLGNNNIYANTGNISIIYHRSDFQKSILDIVKDTSLSPTATVTKTDSTATITINDKNGTTTATISDGATGDTPNITIGTVETLPYNLNATVEITGTQEEPVLNFGIPGILTYNETGEAAIASFSDGADDMPCKSVICQVDAVQSGSGDPSPDNIRPISGWDGMTVVRSGRNLLPVTKSTYTRTGIISTPNDDGSFTLTGTATALTDLPIAGGLSDVPIPKTLQIGGKTYKYNGGVLGLNGETGNTLYVTITASNGTQRYVGNKGAEFTEFTLAENEVVSAVFVRVANGTVANAVIKPMIVDGSETDTTFEPYQGDSHSLSFPSTVYGGWVDVVKGELHVTHGIVDLGTLTWTKSDSSIRFRSSTKIDNALLPGTSSDAPDAICSEMKVVRYLDVPSLDFVVTIIFKTSASAGQVWCNFSNYNDKTADEFKAAMSGVQLCYKLATEQVIPLDPVTISTLLGNNNIYANTGGIRNVIYPVSSTLYDNITAAIRIGEEIEDQLQEIQEQINSVGSKIVTVTGTDVTITGEDNTIYVCGEVSTISITPPQTGIINVLFTSGTSKAILTLPNTVKMPEWFVVEEDQTYEISILNGVYGTVMSWAN